jgi:hypothetical protein
MSTATASLSNSANCESQIRHEHSTPVDKSLTCASARGSDTDGLAHRKALTWDHVARSKVCKG